MDRADAERRDAQWITERLANPDSRILPFWRLNPLATTGENPRLAWQDNKILHSAAAKAEPVLLGLNNDIAHFALDVTSSSKSDANSEEISEENPIELLGLPDNTLFQDARGIATEVSGEESGTLAHARAVVGWHQRNGFCSNCGATTYSTKGGKERICNSCEAHHFPRTDPVAIMAVTEMSDVRWVSREEVLVALDIATKPNYSLTDETEEAGVRVPGPIAIAHHIIKAWANDE